MTISDNVLVRRDFSHLAHMLINRLRPAAPTTGSDQGGEGESAPVILDELALSKLRDLDPKGEAKLIERVMKAFDGSVARLLSQLGDAHRSGDLKAIRLVAHTLKSSSASIGALNLSQICAEIEAGVRLGNLEGLDERLATMSAEVVRVQAALRLVAGGRR